jgi:uncharacterized protein (DUF2384 family)
MGTPSEDAVTLRHVTGRSRGVAAKNDPRAFWVMKINRQRMSAKDWRRAFQELVGRVVTSSGVSQTTFRRKEAAKEALPDVAGYRVMGLLRVAATLRKLLEESGDPEQLQDFDLEGWVVRWISEELAELGGKTPAEMLRNPEGQRAVEEVLERMRGGLPA